MYLSKLLYLHPSQNREVEASEWQLRVQLICFLGVWEQIKMKLGAQVGQENMAHLETAIAQGEEGMETVKKVQKEGVSGAMEVVQDQATEIKETAVSEVKNWAITAIIQAAIPKILSMFNPAGAIVQAILAIYKAVTWFVMNFKRIIQWAKAVFDSIAHIASGAIGEATKKVEETMGRSLGLVITFLASQIGLGKVGDAIKKVIQKVRQPIEKVVDKVVKWIADKARKLKNFFKKKNGESKKKNNEKNEMHPEDAKKKLEIISKEIKPSLKEKMRDGISKSKLKKYLSSIKRTYNLTNVEILDNGEIKFIINPFIILDDPKGKKVHDAQLAKLLMPIFEQAEKEYLRELLKKPVH
jgi:hypothetical protein